MILVTGGCGFIGSAYILQWLQRTGEPVVNLDLLTYAGHPGNLAELEGDQRYRFVRFEPSGQFAQCRERRGALRTSMLCSRQARVQRAKPQNWCDYGANFGIDGRSRGRSGGQP